MARVTILTHSEFYHRASGVRFRPMRVGRVVLGVADVPDDVAHAHFADRPEFDVLYPTVPESGKDTEADAIRVAGRGGPRKRSA